MRTPLLLLPLVLLVNGCNRSESPEASPDSSLLLREPDAVIEQEGVLVPSPGAQWGSLGPFDWEDRTESWKTEGKELAFVWSRDPVAKLLLPAGPPRDRTLRLTLWTPAAERAEGEPPLEATVSLNDIVLTTTVVQPEPTVLELLVHAEVWKETRNNLLEIALPATHELEPDRSVGIALARVEYDQPSEVMVDTRRGEVVLGAPSAVFYDVETLVPTHLVLRGQASGEGTLTLGAVRLDPETGDPLSEEIRSTVELDGQEIERALPPPSGEEGILRVRVGWTSESEGSFRLTDLQRIESGNVERFPVVFISIDTLSADHLPFYGYSRDTAPRLAEFVRDATLFEHCVTNAPWTVPSYMSQMTGLYAYANRLGSRTRGQARAELWEKWYLSQNRWTLAEFMRAAGFKTAAFADNLWLTERFGFPQGFDVFDASAGAIPKPDPDGGIRHVLELGNEWLKDEARDSPFFLFLHAFDVHSPYTPPKPYDSLFADRPLYAPDRTAPVRGNSDSMGIIHNYTMYGQDYDAIKAPARVRTAPFADAYDEGIAMVDAELGAFFDDLRERGLYDRSLIIISADHGETMDDSEMLFAHGVMDETVLHVPLLIRFPRGEHAGERVSTTVQLVDLYPTILEMLGVKGRTYLHGRSLLPVLRGSSEPRPTYTEGGVMSQRSVVFGGWKLVEKIPGEDSSASYILSWPDIDRVWQEEIIPWLGKLPPKDRARRAYEELLKRGMDPLPIFERIRDEGLYYELFDSLMADKGPEMKGVLLILRRYFSKPRYELYDLSEDPRARHNVASEHPKRVSDLLSLMETEKARMELSRKQARPPSEPPKLSAEDIAELAAIGYASPGASEQDEDEGPPKGSGGN